MEEIWVFGCGLFFKNRKNILEKKYKIIGFLDNSVNEGCCEMYLETTIPKINPNDFNFQLSDKIIIMSNSYFSIWCQLIKKGIPFYNVLFGQNISIILENEGKDDAPHHFLSFHDRVECELKGRTYRIRSLNDANDLKKEEMRILNPLGKYLLNIPVQPLSHSFGLDRGTPIDRYYIQKFLEKNRTFIKGKVLEIGDREYTKMYGKEVEKSYILHVSGGEDTIKGNLENGEGIIPDFVDCFIVTQTLPFIYDVKAAIENIVKSLKAGGIALITVPGIVQISRYDMERWGQYWSFTEASLRKMFQNIGEKVNLDIEVFGNVKAATYMLYGVSCEEIETNILEEKDEDYQVIITAIVTKES